VTTERFLFFFELFSQSISLGIIFIGNRQHPHICGAIISTIEIQKDFSFFSLVSTMAAFLSFSRRKAYETAGNQQPIDPWNLGVSTSTSSVDSIAHQSSGDDTLLSTRTPPTPEGLRPRKSIQRIRKDVLECYHHRQESNFKNNLSREYNIATDAKLTPPQSLPRTQYGSSFQATVSSFREPSAYGILPFSLQDARRSPLDLTSSFYKPSLEDNENWNEEDIDIVSLAENNFSQKHERKMRRQQKIAVSPNLKSGGKAKTAVGALVFAMAESSPNNPHGLASTKETNDETSHHSILPPRTWMTDHQYEGEYLVDEYADEDDTIDCDGDDDDNQSSLHASPSSIRLRRKSQFQQDTSFTRGILNNEHNSSWLEETSNRDHLPYNFNSIMTEEGTGASLREKIDAPRILSLVNDTGGLNVSAISHSLHQRDLETLHSLADTMDDEEEEYKEIPPYYQALTDTYDVVNNDALLLAEDNNHRRIKEDILRSAFERLQYSLDLLKEVFDIHSSLFLGVQTTKSGRKYCRLLEDLLLELQEKDSCDTRRQALLFCLSLIQNTNQISDISPFPTYLPNHCWKPLPGFRSSLGLEEEPQSPSTIRGGDTSLFSLPSDSANDSTPHTSNVSMTTTITTVISPEKNTSQFFNRQQRPCYVSSDRDNDDVDRFGTRRTVESLVNLLRRLETSCQYLESKTGVAEKLKVIEDIKKVYLELLIVPTQDLKQIMKCFEMKFDQTSYLTRTVSDDQDIRTSRSIRRPLPSYENVKMIQKNEAESADQRQVALARGILRVNIVQCDDNEVNDNHNQSIECDLWSPTTNDMNSLIHPQNIEESVSAMRNEYTAVVDEEEHVDDLRRTVGSFDRESDQEEREAAPLWDEDLRDNVHSATGTTRRQRSRKGRNWKKRFLALKNRGRQKASE
jgi:hypothetical protein